MCSQVDSFTPEKGAAHALCPVQSYRKCNSVPLSDVTANPISCHRDMDRFISTIPYILCVSVYEGRVDPMRAGVIIRKFPAF